ncbi:MAG: response regulator transcription factor [Oscillospiraceae bacterium]|nr:response regulator transcription factor [Oscillospiraceae bacterium]
MRVLMVEDEKYAARAVAEVLKKNKYAVDLVFDGEDGLEYALSGIYDIIILDIMLPKKDGLTVLKEVRENGIDIPVILLTAKSQTEDKVRGLDLGADDYLPKPYHTEELLARLRALNRRKSELNNGGIIGFGDIQLSPHELTLVCGKKQTTLKLKESQILELLMNNSKQILSKNAIIERVWGYDTDAEDNHVETHISRLRKAMNAVQSNAEIKTVRGAGYVLCLRS